MIPIIIEVNTQKQSVKQFINLFETVGVKVNKDFNIVCLNEKDKTETIMLSAKAPN